MNPEYKNDNNLLFDENLSLLNYIEHILASEQYLDECMGVLQMTRLPLRLQVWAQDYKYQLSRLQSIKDDIFRVATSQCGDSCQGHNWREDHIETKNGEEMKKIVYCSRCELTK